MIPITDQMVDELVVMYREHHGHFHYSGMLLEVVKKHGARGTEGIKEAMRNLRKAHGERQNQRKEARSERRARDWRRIA